MPLVPSAVTFCGACGIVRGVAGQKGYPIMLMNRYSKGIISLLTIPENPADLYNLPQGLITSIMSMSSASIQMASGA